MVTNSFTFEYQPGTIHHGPGIISDLASELERHDCSRALVVTGSTVADTSAVMNPIQDGLGETLTGVFDAVTSEKYLQTAYQGAKQVREESVDALVGLGGGSSLDMAKIIGVLVSHDRPLPDIVDAIMEQGAMIVPDDGTFLDLFAVPTTLPGADLSQVAGVKLAMEPAGTPKSEIPNGGVSDARVMPTAVFHDLDLFATTPDQILATSAMNGFDKGVETLYSNLHTPITDATAIRGLQLLQTSLPAVTDETTSEDDFSRILKGITLAQYGLSTPDAYRASIIHAFGHALSRNYDIQQGVAHAIAAPHVLQYLFSEVDGRRDLLADALNVHDRKATDEETARSVVSAVTETRDALGLPSKLRSVAEAEQSHFPELARAVIGDSFMAAAPERLDPEQEAIKAVFESMW